jgi:hypothetical protein
MTGIIERAGSRSSGQGARAPTRFSDARSSLVGNGWADDVSALLAHRPQLIIEPQVLSIGPQSVQSPWNGLSSSRGKVAEPGGCAAVNAHAGCFSSSLVSSGNL